MFAVHNPRVRRLPSGSLELMKEMGRVGDGPQATDACSGAQPPRHFFLTDELKKTRNIRSSKSDWPEKDSHRNLCEIMPFVAVKILWEDKLYISELILPQNLHTDKWHNLT
jgi:hypothetical protein